MINQIIPQAPVIPIQGPVPTYQRDEDSELGLSSFFNTISDNRRMIVSITLIVTLLGVVYAYLSKPTYEANMLIHVEEDGRPHEAKNILGEMASTFDVKSSATSEMELLRSRLVISRAVDNLRLNVNAHPRYLPMIGSALAENSTTISTPGLFGHGGYVWGSEKINVSHFNVPNGFQNKNFVITAEGNDQYRLTEEEHGLEVHGQVGKSLTYPTASGEIVLIIEQLVGAPGAEFILKKSSSLSTIEELQKAMTVSEQGKQSGILSVTLKGKDREAVSSTLNAISQEYIRQNRARKTEEAEKSLGFLDQQMPELKRQLEQSEIKYNQFRNSHGTIDLSEEAKISLQQSATAKAKRLELQQKKTELLTRFTSEHPIVVGVNSQISEMNDEIKTVAEHIKQLPMLEQELLSLNRDIKVNTDLYAALLNTAQQLRLITAGKVSNVRLVDAPMMPEKPTKPRSAVAMLSLFLGLTLGLVSAFVKKSLNDAIDDPDQIERSFGIPVYAVIPHSKQVKELFNRKSTKLNQVPLLAHVSTSDAVIESLRSFRTALQFSMLHAENKVVMMTGATPGLGKTFVAANLAAIIAITGKKVLLIDSDIRNGRLHQYFGVGRQVGLSDYLAGTESLDKVIHHAVFENLDFISTGYLSRNPSELLLRPRFGQLFQELSANYDLILIDSTPILPVSDTLTIGAHAGSIFLMTRAGLTKISEIRESLKRLRQAGLTAKGVLFNDIKLRPDRYGYGYTYGKSFDNTYSVEKKPLIGNPSISH